MGGAPQPARARRGLAGATPQGSALRPEAGERAAGCSGRSGRRAEIGELRFLLVVTDR